MSTSHVFKHTDEETVGAQLSVSSGCAGEGVQIVW